MKKLLLLFISFSLLSCSNIRELSDQSKIIECPRVFFSSESNIYINGPKDNLDVENINYKASLNNSGFVEDCISNNNFNYYNLDLLILVELISKEIKNINIPIFVLLYDSKGKLIDKKYFQYRDEFIHTNQKSEYKTIEKIINLNISHDADIKIDSFIIGFARIR